MSEWLKAHAWKAIVASITKQHRNIFSATSGEAELPDQVWQGRPENVDADIARIADFTRRCDGHLHSGSQAGIC